MFFFLLFYFSQVQKWNTCAVSDERLSMPKILQTFSHGHCFILEKAERRENLDHLYIFWFWSVLMARPFFVQPTVGLGMPLASQDKVV